MGDPRRRRRGPQGCGRTRHFWCLSRRTDHGPDHWLSGQPDAVSRFLAAMFEAQQSYKRDPTTAIKAMANELGISSGMAEEIYKQDPKPTFQQEVTAGSPYAIVGSARHR